MNIINFRLLKDIPWYKTWFIYTLWEDPNYKSEDWIYIVWKYSIQEMETYLDFFERIKEFNDNELEIAGFDLDTLQQKDEESVWNIKHSNGNIYKIVDMWNGWWDLSDILI